MTVDTNIVIPVYCINLNFLLRNLSNPQERSLIQPAFVLASLAMATLMRSSDIERGEAGRTHALWLRDHAQRALEDSWNNRWVDVPLAEAALVGAFNPAFPASLHTVSIDSDPLRALRTSAS